MEYIKDIQKKDPDVAKDSPIQEVYSCGHKAEKVTVTSNVIGLLVIVTVICFLIYRFCYRSKAINLNEVLVFADKQDVIRLFIGLLLLVNIKTLSNSLIRNVILPVVKPILPLLSCNLRFRVGMFDLEIGNFVSDLLVFVINLYIIYFLFVIIMG
jgi:hypothetical protein